MIDQEKLRELAIIEESQSYYKWGKYIDGSPYSFIYVSDAFFALAKEYFGSYQVLELMVETLGKSNGFEADRRCGNWIIWAIFIELGVARELPKE